jgi:hypothetical protein
MGAHSHQQEIKASFIFPDDGGYFYRSAFLASGTRIRENDHGPVDESFVCKQIPCQNSPIAVLANSS